MAWLALDIGSTHWKAGVYDDDGGEALVSRFPIPLCQDAAGNRAVPADTVRQSLARLVRGVPEASRRTIRGVGVTGMAEGGLLLDRESLKPRSGLLPWFDRRAEGVFRRLENDVRFAGRYAVTGLPKAQKYSIYKILALLEETGLPQGRALWLGAVDYAAFLLTGRPATDPTLAARTYAYDIIEKRWDTAFIESLGLDPGMFPAVLQGGSPAGALTEEAAAETGLPAGIPVSVCGHDHLCAAFGARAFEEGGLYCSAGTAQVLAAKKPGRELSETDQKTGLSFGPEPGGGLHVLGAIQSSGGSVSLMNSLLYREEGFVEYLQEAGQSALLPGELLYFPYLAGSGPPHMDSGARGAFIGLTAGTTRGDLLQAVYQGLSFETRMIMDAGKVQANEMAVSGGLTEHPLYLKTLADALGLMVRVPACREGTLYGAARLIAREAGRDFMPLAWSVSHEPDPESSRRYAWAYENRYLPLQRALGVFCSGQGGAAFH